MSSRIAAIVAATLLLPGAAAAQDRVVNVYNWSDYIGEGVLEDFTAETGIRVVYDSYDNNEIVEAKMFAGGAGYDIVVPTAANVGRMIEVGIFMPLDKSKLPNLANLWPEINALLEKYDPGNAHAVDYMWGTTGIGYNVAKIAERMPDAPTDSWAMIFDPAVAGKFADCGIYLLDSSDDLIPPALVYLGLNADSRDAGELQRAADLIKTVRPFIQKFHSSEYINALANGDICVAVGYSGDLLQARDRAAENDNGVEIAYTIPKEGALIWLDAMVIPADAPHPDEAHEFINFMQRPDIAARNTDYIFYANGNLASQALIDPEVLGDPGIYPPSEVMAKLFVTTPYPLDVQQLVTRLWTEIKAGR